MENKMRAVFCFEVAAESKLVIDEDGNYCKGHVMGSMKNKDHEVVLIEKSLYIETLERYRDNFSSLFETAKENLKALTLEEYANNVYDSEDLHKDDIEEKSLLLKYHEESKEDYITMIGELEES